MSGNHRRPGLELWARIAIVAVAVFVSFVAALTFFSIHYFEDEYEDGLGRHQLLLASRTAADLDRRISFAQETLAKIAAAVEPRMLSDPAVRQRFLDERITLRILFDDGLFLL